MSKLIDGIIVQETNTSSFDLHNIALLLDNVPHIVREINTNKSVSKDDYNNYVIVDIVPHELIINNPGICYHKDLLGIKINVKLKEVE